MTIFLMTVLLYYSKYVSPVTIMHVNAVFLGRNGHTAAACMSETDNNNNNINNKSMKNRGNQFNRNCRIFVVYEIDGLPGCARAVRCEGYKNIRPLYCPIVLITYVRRFSKPNFIRFTCIFRYDNRRQRLVVYHGGGNMLSWKNGE